MAKVMVAAVAAAAVAAVVAALAIVPMEAVTGAETGVAVVTAA